MGILPEPKINLKEKANGEQEQTRFSPRSSATLIVVLAWLSLIIGIIMIFIALFHNKNASYMLFVYIGGGLIVSSAYMFVIYNLATDVQALSYDLNVKMKNDDNYQDDILQVLQEINEKLFHVMQ